MYATLTDIDHVLEFLPGRTRGDEVADEVYAALLRASGVVAAYTNIAFTDDVQTVSFHTAPGAEATPGPVHLPFGNRVYPSYTLPVVGPVDNLTLRYAGHARRGRDFLWSSVEPLIEGEDYVYQQEAGTVWLLFDPGHTVMGLQASFNLPYHPVSELLSGADKEALLSQTDANTELQPLDALFYGTDRKAAADSAKAEGIAPELAKLTLELPRPLALHQLVLRAPTDEPVVTGQPVVIEVTTGPEGAETVLALYPVPDPVAGQVYTLQGDSDVVASRYTVTITGAENGQVRVASLGLRFYDGVRYHLRGSVPDPVSTATAVLAAFYVGQRAPGTRSNDDDGGRVNIPQDVLAMLAPYRRRSVRFI